MSVFNINSLVDFLKSETHIRNGVLLYSNLVDWSVQKTQFKIGELKFLNIEDRIDPPVNKYAEAKHNDIKVRISLREPELDKKGNLIANSLMVSIHLYDAVCVSRIFTDVWVNTVGSKVFEQMLIDMMVELQKERFKYLVCGVDAVCEERRAKIKMLED